MASDQRILTTHAGSLPRPSRLVQIYADRVAVKVTDTAEPERQAAAATRWVVRQQCASGIDIPNNGEQAREAFFLYLRRRMTGFSGHGQRKPWRELWIIRNSSNDLPHAEQWPLHYNGAATRKTRGVVGALKLRGLV